MPDKQKKYVQSYGSKRQWQCYPPPRYHALADAFRSVHEMGESETLTHIIKTFFDSMPETERQILLKRAQQLKKPCQPCKKHSLNSY